MKRQVHAGPIDEGFFAIILAVAGGVLTPAGGIALRQQIGETPVAAQVGEADADPSLQSVTVGEVTVTAGGFRTVAGPFEADVCFGLPTPQDWTIHEATLRFGDQVITGYGYGFELIERVEPEGGRPGRRCDTLFFSIGRDAQVDDFTRAIETIAAAPYEGETCEPEYLAMYQRALDKRNLGITVDRIRDVPGVGGLRVVDKPASMTTEEAQAIVGDWDLYIQLRGRRGPWVFTGRLQ